MHVMVYIALLGTGYVAFSYSLGHAHAYAMAASAMAIVAIYMIKSEISRTDILDELKKLNKKP